MDIMERASFAKMDCPIARAVDEVGEGWMLLILREAFKGARTYGDFESRLPVAPNTLARRLEALCSRSLLKRHGYQKKPPRDEYLPTAKALDLLPVLIALGEWGNRWLAPEGRLIEPVDTKTGRPMKVAVVDRRTGKPLAAGRIALRAGPGAKRATRAALSRPLLLAGRSLS